jgi:hypothetical protein
MGVCQIIWIVLMGLSLCANAYLHGKETKNNFWGALISVGIQVALLAFGGFFG